jgi:hypothetical protein
MLVGHRESDGADVEGLRALVARSRGLTGSPEDAVTIRCRTYAVAVWFSTGEERDDDG